MVLGKKALVAFLVIFMSDSDVGHIASSSDRYIRHRLLENRLMRHKAQLLLATEEVPEELIMAMHSF
ncbi:hypothetical protein F2Q69_00015017 [Brassica cretica]|uniref:Uncharacterized protein n=1 Tax=Brassica cretica TaxID=69181 RepID=A0A8S9R7H2_BRACR|nr:hypothetical protein F2Q69_00015017 [Brassica cretica]